MDASLPLSLDHVVLLTGNLERVADLFTGLGFTVTPRTEHSPAMGTANRCVMLGSTYIEILTVVRNTERSAGWRDLLAQGGGLRGLALRTGDAVAACDVLNAAGLDAGEVLSFAREDETGQSLRHRQVNATVTGFGHKRGHETDPPSSLCPPPLPGRSDQPCCLVVLPISAQSAHGGGDAGGAGHRGQS